MEPGLSVGNKKPPPPHQSTMVASSCVYRDHSHLTDDDKELNALMEKADAEGVKGTDQTFPVKLHQLLSGSDEDGFSSIVSWQPHGRSFIVKKHAEFVEKVLPCCFRQSKFASFQRQLNLYGFRRITHGRDKGGYYHELFLRGRSLLVLKMQRTKVKGTGARKASSPETEPDFYAMPFVHDSRKKPSAALASPPAAAMPTPTPSVAMSPVAVAPSQALPSLGLSPLMVGSPSLASRNTRLDQLSAGLVKVSPPTFGASKPMNSSLTRAALLGFDMPSASSSSLSRLPLASSSLLAGTASLAEPRRDMTTAMLAARARLDHLREAPPLASTSSSINSSLLSSASLLAGRPTARGPLHLNGLGMPCDCAIPAF